MDRHNEAYALKWSDFRSDFTEGFRDLLKEETMVDVTLAVEGKVLQAHKLVLSVCSPYFKHLFKINPCKHPIVILKDVSHHVLSYMLEFMYKGEVGVRQDDLSSFLNLAETLKVKGLAGELAQRDSTLLLRRRRIVSQENKRKLQGPTSDSESEVNLGRMTHSRRPMKRRQKPNSKSFKKQKMKVEVVKIEEDVEDPELEGGDDSDCSPLVTRMRTEENSADRTHPRLPSVAEENSADNDDYDDTANEDFLITGPIFHSESTSDQADQSLQGQHYEVAQQRLIDFKHSGALSVGNKPTSSSYYLPIRQPLESVDLDLGKRSKSILWNWFRMEGNQQVTCLVCPDAKQFAYHTTGHMSRHLRSRHPDQYATFAKQQKLIIEKNMTLFNFLARGHNGLL